MVVSRNESEKLMKEKMKLEHLKNKCQQPGTVVSLLILSNFQINSQALGLAIFFAFFQGMREHTLFVLSIDIDWSKYYTFCKKTYMTPYIKLLSYLF